MSRKSSRSRSAPALHSLLQQASRQATSELRRLAGAEGVPVEFWRVLEVLADEQGRSMSALAEAAGMQMPATSKLVDRMVDAALVQRSIDAADQRRLVLHISDFGLQKVEALRADMKQHQRRVDRELSGAHQRQLRSLLEAFIRAHRAGGQ